MNPIKFLKCLVVGHTLEERSIINFMDKGNWLKKCSCCGLYRAKSKYYTPITVTEKTALKMKKRFEEKFPYSKEVGGMNE